MEKFRFATLMSFFILIFATACNNEEGNENPVSRHAVSGYFMTDEGTPITDAIVEATDGEGNLFSTSTTNQAGSFEVINIPENTENSIVSFVKDGTIIKQLKLSTLITMSAKGGKTDILLGGQYDYEAVFAVKVIDKDTQEPIEDAYVCLSTSENAKFEATTNATGYAYLPQIVPGRYYIHIAHNDYDFYGENLLFLFPEGMDTVSFTFPLTPKDSSNTGGGNDTTYNDTCCNNSITVRVFYAETNLPFANCEVRVLSGNTFIQKTNSNGIAIFDSLCSGRYTILAYGGNDYHISNKAVNLSCDEHLTIELYATKHKDTTGYDTTYCCDNVVIINYKDQNGNPINSEKATLTEAGIFKEAKVNNGRAIFTGICKRNTPYNFSTTIVNVVGNVQFSMTQPLSNIMINGCKDTIERTLIFDTAIDTICCNNSITIEILDSTSYGYGIIDDADVTILWIDANNTPHSVKAQFIKGVYFLDGLCTGRYTIRIEANGIIREDVFYVTCDDHPKRYFYF